MKWYWWYMWLLIGLTAFVLRDRPFDLLYAIPGNLILYWLPVYIVVRIVRFFRKPVAPPTVAPPPS